MRLQGRILALVLFFTFSAIHQFIFSNQASAAPAIGRSDIQIVQIGPWLSGVQRGYEILVPPAQLEDLKPGEVGRLWPASISYSPETSTVKPFIQPDLSIGLRYRYGFTFNLSASNSAGRRSAIPTGWYQIHMALVEENEDLTPYQRFVSSTSFFQNVTSGSFNRIVTFSFPDMTATTRKHHLYVELVPLQETCETYNTRLGQIEKNNCITLNENGSPDPTRSTLRPVQNFKSFNFEMPFIPFFTSGGKQRDPEDILQTPPPYIEKSLAEYIARSYAEQNKKRLVRPIAVSPAKYAKIKNLLLSSLNAMTSGQLRAATQAARVNQSDVEKTLYRIMHATQTQDMALSSRDQSAIKALTYMLLAANKYPEMTSSMLARTFHNPQQFFRVSRVVHVGTVDLKSSKVIKAESFSYNLLANYMHIRSHSEDTSVSSGMSLGAVPFKILEPLGIPKFVDVSISHSTSRSETESQNAMSSMSLPLDFNYYLMKIPTTNSQVCLEVTPVAMRFSPFRPRGEINAQPRGLYICDRRQDLVLQETFAHMFERCRDTAGIECYSAMTQDINIALRGDREISALLYSIRNVLTPGANDGPSIPFASLPTADSFFSTTPANDTMLSVSPVEFVNETTPSFQKEYLTKF